MANEIALFKTCGITNPVNVSYSSSANAFVGRGYTSMAGNVYFNAARFAEGILIKEDVGKGYRHTFLNGLHIYDLHSKNLLCERAFTCRLYNKESVKRAVKLMLEDVLFTASDKANAIINQDEVRNYISNMIDRSFETHQIQMMQQQAKALNF